MAESIMRRLIMSIGSPNKTGEGEEKGKSCS